MNTNYLFVYGTLRQGGVRDIRKLSPASAFLSRGTVQGLLYDLGAYPGLLLEKNGTAISGEVYQVSDAVLIRLDAIEGVDRKNPAASAYH